MIAAPAKGDRPDADETREFITNGRQNANSHPGTWPTPILVLGKENKFVMIGRAEDGNDCVVAPFTGRIAISIPQILDDEPLHS